jgi:hypothetical protein
LWKLLKHELSEHGRRTLIHALSFSPLTPTGSYTLHLGDPKEHRIAVNLIALAHTMSMEWARRCIQLRETALAETLVQISEETRIRTHEIERRANRDKKRQQMEDQAAKMREEAKVAAKNAGDDVAVEEEEKEREKEVERRFSMMSPKPVDGPLPMVNDPLLLLEQDQGNTSTQTNHHNSMDEEHEWKWSALVVRHQQRRKWLTESKEYAEMEEEAVSPLVPPLVATIPDMQRLDTEGLAAWHTAVDASQHFNPVPTTPSTVSAVPEVPVSPSKTSKTSKTSKSSKTSKERIRFSCVRNCTYRQNEESESMASTWNLLDFPLPTTGTVTFDFVSSPSTMVETACALPHATNVDVLNCLRRVKQLVLLSHDQLKRKQAEIMQKAKEKEILKQKLKHSQRAKKQVNAAKNNGNKGAASPTKTGKKNKSNNKPHKKLQHQHHHRYHPKHRASLSSKCK